MSLVADTDPRTGTEGAVEPLAIELPRQGLPTPVIVAIVALLGLGLFALLESKREARIASEAGGQRQISLAQPPPPLAIPQPVAVPTSSPAQPGRSPRPTATARIEVMPRTTPSFAPPPTSFRPIQPTGPDVYAPPRYNHDLQAAATSPNGAPAPAMVIDLSSGKGANLNGSGEAGATQGEEDAVRATVIHNRAAVVPQGVIVPAVLETPLNSDRPGLARAVVTHDVRGFDGTRVLIPRGSRVIGEFKADTSPGARRILVTWSRLIRPDGVAIRIGSPSSDALGGAGIPGRTNTHFLERFAGAVLQSALTIGVNVASQIPSSNSNGSNIYLGLPSQVAQLGQDLVPDSHRPPTIKVKAGAEIAIFVAHDLDFGGTPAVR